MSEREIEKITAFINAKEMPDAECRKFAELQLEVLLEQLVEEN